MTQRWHYLQNLLIEFALANLFSSPFLPSVHIDSSDRGFGSGVNAIVSPTECQHSETRDKRWQLDKR